LLLVAKLRESICKIADLEEAQLPSKRSDSESSTPV